MKFSATYVSTRPCHAVKKHKAEIVQCDMRDAVAVGAPHLTAHGRQRYRSMLYSHQHFGGIVVVRLNGDASRLRLY